MTSTSTSMPLPPRLPPALSRRPDARRAGVGGSEAGVGDGPVQEVLLDGLSVVRWLLARHGVLARSADPRRSALFRGAVARRLCVELTVHLQLAQELLYPRLRDAVGDASAIDRAEVEHECLRGLMGRLYRMAPDDPLFDARVTVLGEIFEQHQRHEMQHVFPLLRGLGGDRLAAALRQRRQELLAQLDGADGLCLDNEEADPVGEPPR